jgi:hypothetical protein
VLWVEHGHQYDECCSFEHQLYPRQPDSDELVMNVDTAGTRYITNYVLEAESHQQEDWSFFGYLSFGLGLGVRGALRLARGYGKFSASLIRAYRAVTRERLAREQVRAGHIERLKKLSERWNVSEETLRHLDELRRPPVVGHLRRLLSVLMIDKVIVYTPLIFIAVLCLLFFGLPWGAVGTGVCMATARALTRWTGRGRPINPAANLEIVSERILRRIDARYVVFGHTHEPVARKLEEGRIYFNTGTWVPSGKPGLLSSFTHCILRRTEGGGTQAELCQWRDGASRSFTPEWTQKAQAGQLATQRRQRRAFGNRAPAPTPTTTAPTPDVRAA